MKGRVYIYIYFHHYYLQGKSLGCDSLDIWIMHEYELTATLPGQRTSILCKLKRKYGEAEASCIEEDQSSRYLLPNLENYIANNAIEAEAATCLTDQPDPDQISAQLNLTNGNEGLDFKYQSTEWWNSYQSGSKVGNSVAAGERSIHGPSIVAENDGSTMLCNSEIVTAEDSTQILSNPDEDSSTDEVFEGLEALSEVQGNRFGQLFEEWISVEGFGEICSNGGICWSFAGRKRPRTNYEGYDPWDM